MISEMVCNDIILCIDLLDMQSIKHLSLQIKHFYSINKMFFLR